MTVGKRSALLSGMLLTLLAGSCVKDRTLPVTSTGTTDQKLIHYWNFNGPSAPLIPTNTIGGGAITVSAAYDTVNAGTGMNVRSSADSGAALRVRNPSDSMVWTLPTKGYKTPIVSFAVMRTGSGAQQNNVSYTTDGTTYRTDSISLTTVTVTEMWQLIVLDFSDVKSTANNAAFAVKIKFANGNTNTSGNDRYDNLAVMAEPMATAPQVSGDSILHRWNFNAATADLVVFTQPTQTIGGGTLAYSAIWDTAAMGTTINATTGTATGSALKLKNPSGSFTLSAPTTGFTNVLLKFATARNSTGPQTQTVAYSLDGTTFTSANLNPYTFTSIGTDYQIISLDFSGIAGAADNANFKVRISYSVGNGNPAGYTLMDNISVEGDPK